MTWVYARLYPFLLLEVCREKTDHVRILIQIMNVSLASLSARRARPWYRFTRWKRRGCYRQRLSIFMSWVVFELIENGKWRGQIEQDGAAISAWPREIWWMLRGSSSYRRQGPSSLNRVEAWAFHSISHFSVSKTHRPWRFTFLSPKFSQLSEPTQSLTPDLPSINEWGLLTFFRGGEQQKGTNRLEGLKGLLHIQSGRHTRLPPIGPLQNQSTSFPALPISTDNSVEGLTRAISQLPSIFPIFSHFSHSTS